MDWIVEHENGGLYSPELDALYSELPAVSCTACGKCCSSPHITFVEAFTLFDWLFQNVEPPQIEKIFNADSVAQATAFNLKCRFEGAETKLCGVHPARGFICRVFGFPVLDRMGIPGMDNCRETDRKIVPEVRLTKMDRWLARLAELNTRVAPFNVKPYYVSGLNIETWLDVAERDYGRPPFTVYHRILNQLPFRTLSLTYSDRTNLSTRLAKIDTYWQSDSLRLRTQAERLLRDLSASEPMTGSFFRFDADRLLTQTTPHAA